MDRVTTSALSQRLNKPDFIEAGWVSDFPGLAFCKISAFSEVVAYRSITRAENGLVENESGRPSSR